MRFKDRVGTVGNDKSIWAFWIIPRAVIRGRPSDCWFSISTACFLGASGPSIQPERTELFKMYVTAELYFIGGNCNRGSRKFVAHGTPCISKLSENWQASQFSHLTHLVEVIEYTAISKGHALNLSRGTSWIWASMFSLAVLRSIRSFENPEKLSNNK